MTKLRTGDPWQSPPEYGATLAGASVNLVVREVARSLRFYTQLLGFGSPYSDPDFAAREGYELKVQLHADQPGERMP